MSWSAQTARVEWLTPVTDRHVTLRAQVGPDDIAIQIAFAGICHSDLHQIKNEWGGASFPMVPGCAPCSYRRRWHSAPLCCAAVNLHACKHACRVKAQRTAVAQRCNHPLQGPLQRLSLGSDAQAAIEAPVGGFPEVLTVHLGGAGTRSWVPLWRWAATRRSTSSWATTPASGARAASCLAEIAFAGSVCMLRLEPYITFEGFTSCREACWLNAKQQEPCHI